MFSPTFPSTATVGYVCNLRAEKRILAVIIILCSFLTTGPHWKAACAPTWHIFLVIYKMLVRDVIFTNRGKNFLLSPTEEKISFLYWDGWPYCKQIANCWDLENANQILEKKDQFSFYILLVRILLKFSKNSIL